jgi:hypothetical protein
MGAQAARFANHHRRDDAELSVRVMCGNLRLCGTLGGQTALDAMRRRLMCSSDD